MTAPRLQKQLIVVIDRRTSLLCLNASGQVRELDEPYDTIGGSFLEPPFHPHCRSISVPHLDGFPRLTHLAGLELGRRAALKAKR